MTTEEKAKAYDEALEIARQIHNGNPSSGTAIVVCEQIFPQLRESEDERIRKWLVNYFGSIKTVWLHMDITCEQILAWLEKQKEQKVDIDKLRRYLYQSGYNDGYQHGKEDAQKEQKPVEYIKTEELTEHIKGEFESFRNLLKKKGIDYQPTEGYWIGLAYLFISSAKKLQKPVEPSDEELQRHQDDAYNNVLTFLSTLESEKPKDLEEAADNHIREVVDAAGHPGWEWETRDIKDAFIAGAEWQKEQMMEEAVEGEIVKDISNRLVVTAKNVNLDGFKFGEKVSIIIVKEDEK